MLTDWLVVVPVKGTSGSKSRLGASPELARAIALDTVEAAVGAARVVVVTTATEAAGFESLGASVLHDAGGGLNAAITAALGLFREQPVAVLLGDLPALSPPELSHALALANEHPRAMVPDNEDGTTLITALPGQVHTPRFGEGSRAAHLAAGYVELPVPVGWGLRRDVDTLEQLLALPPGRLGRRTLSLL